MPGEQDVPKTKIIIETQGSEVKVEISCKRGYTKGAKGNKRNIEGTTPGAPAPKATKR